MSTRCIHGTARDDGKHDTIYNDILRGRRLLKVGPELECAKTHLMELWEKDSDWMNRPRNQCSKVCRGLIPPPPAISEIPYPAVIFPYRRRDDYI